MKKYKTSHFKIIILLFLMIFSIRYSICNAQEFHLGAGLQLFDFKGTILKERMSSGTTNVPIVEKEDVKRVVPVLSLTSDFQIKVFDISNEFMLGFQPGMSFHFWLDKRSQISEQNYFSALQIPIHATVNYGKGATEDSESSFGISAGIGILWNTFTTNYFEETQGSQFAPALIAQIRNENYILRFNYTLSNYSTHYASYTGDIPRLSIGNYGVHLLLNFASVDGN